MWAEPELLWGLVGDMSSRWMEVRICRRSRDNRFTLWWHKCGN